MPKIFECRAGHLQYEVGLRGFGTYHNGEMKGLCGACGEWCEYVADTDDRRRAMQKTIKLSRALKELIVLEKRVSRLEKNFK